MRKLTSSLVWLAFICLGLVVACVGGQGTTCFQDDECNGTLICCHVGSPFTQGKCETVEVCDELQGGGTGGTGGFAGTGGTGGSGGQGGMGGTAGTGGAAGIGGGGGQTGTGGTAGNGGSAGVGGGV